MMNRTESRRGKDWWQGVVAGQAASRESIRGYCRKRGINEKNFYNWRKQLRGFKKAKVQGFIEVKAMQERPQKIVNIQTPGGYRVEVAAGTEQDYVRGILEVLGSLR